MLKKTKTSTNKKDKGKEYHNEKPTTSKDSEITKPEEQIGKQPQLSPELNISSEELNPLRLLYTPGIKVSNRKPKIIYQNFAALESAYKRFGLWNLNKRPEKIENKQDQTTKVNKTSQEYGEQTSRRFLPHQMPIQSSRETQSKRHRRNLSMLMNTIQGPLSELNKWVLNNDRVFVLVRKEHGVRGSIEGRLCYFDKHWNLLLVDVVEIWKRRKFAYGENKFCGATPQDCGERLKSLNIVLPKQQVKSLNRKNVEIRRELDQLMVRGEEIVLVRLAEATKEVDTTKKNEKKKSNSKENTFKDSLR